MKVLLLNGSPHNDPKVGVIAFAFKTLEDIFREEGIETETINVGLACKGGCIDCRYCAEHQRCFIDDPVNSVAEKFASCDGLIVGTPVYYAGVNGALKGFLDRLFHSARFTKRFKLGAAVVSCRRGGASATFDELNKYFTISEMPVVSSRYWNSIHGNSAAEAEKDLEGIATLKQLAYNFSYLLRCLELGKEQLGVPGEVEKARTNFIR